MQDDLFAPFYADVVIWAAYLLIAATVCLTIFSALRSMKKRGVKAMRRGGIPTTRIAYGVGGLLIVSLLATFLLGSSEPIEVGGETYADGLWLCVADMLILTTLVMIIVAVLATICCMAGLSRRMGRLRRGERRAKP